MSDFAVQGPDGRWIPMGYLESLSLGPVEDETIEEALKAFNSSTTFEQTLSVTIEPSTWDVLHELAAQQQRVDHAAAVQRARAAGVGIFAIIEDFRVVFIVSDFVEAGRAMWVPAAGFDISVSRLR